MMKIQKKISCYLFVICISLFTTACTSNNITPEENTEIYEEKKPVRLKRVALCIRIIGLT